MQDWKISDRPVQKIDVLLFERFSNHCLANALEPLRAANALLGRQAYRWQILAPGDRQVTSSSGLAVTPTARLADRPRGDALFIISSYDYRSHASEGTARMLRAAADRYEVLVGLDAGSWLLAAAGLLDRRPATIHFDILDAFAERFPEVRVTRQRSVADGDRWSCGGAMAAFELTSHMIGRAHGAALTLELAAMFMHESVTIFRSGSGIGRDRLVGKAVAIMRAHVETPLPIPAVAARAGCGQRQLDERFRRALGASPRQVYRRLRLTAARQMIESEAIPVAEVAGRTGYASASAFARAFREEFDIAPSSLR